MTQGQRKLLNDASHKGGLAEHKAHRATADLLIASGLLAAHDQHDTGDWRLITTTAGRKELNKPQPEGPPVFLKHRHGLTCHRSNAVFEAGEVTDPATLKSFWAEESARRAAAEKDRKEEARRIARSIRRAA